MPRDERFRITIEAHSPWSTGAIKDRFNAASGPLNDTQVAMMVDRAFMLVKLAWEQEGLIIDGLTVDRVKPE